MVGENLSNHSNPMPSSNGVSHFSHNDTLVAEVISPFLYSPFCLPLESFGFDPNSFQLPTEEQNKTQPGFEKLVPSARELQSSKFAANIRDYLTMTVDATPATLLILMVNNLVLAKNPELNFSRRASRLLTIPHVSSLLTRDAMPFRFSAAELKDRKVFFRNVRPNATLFPDFPNALQSLSFNDFVVRFLPHVWMDMSPSTQVRAMDAFNAWKAYYATKPVSDPKVKEKPLVIARTSLEQAL